MTRKPLHDRALDNSIQTLELYEKQLKLSLDMTIGIEYRIDTLKEFVRANYTGDEKAFKTLAPIVAKNTGTSRRYYDENVTDHRKTDMVVNQAKEKYAEENAAQQAEVSALREGSTADQVQEVPAASGNAGAHLPDVESEGGTAD